MKPLTSFARAIVAVALLLGAFPAVTLAQPNVGTGVEYLGLERANTGQSAVRVDTSTTPNRTEVGCETDRIASTTVNGIRMVGAAASSKATISGVACTGGDTNQTLDLKGAGSSGIGVSQGIDTTVTGSIFLPAMEVCTSTSAVNGTAPTVQNNLVPTRQATGDWAIQRTAAGAETLSVHCNLSAAIQRLATSKGIRVDSFSVVHQITTANLTTNTFNAFSQVVYANNVANAVTNCCGTITVTLPTATQANPYVTAATVGTPTFQITAAAAWNLDWTAVMANTGVYRVYGVIVTYTLALY